MLVILKLKSLKMVGYSESYADLKIDVEICFCMIHVDQLDSLEIVVGFVLFMFRCVDWYV